MVSRYTTVSSKMRPTSLWQPKSTGIPADAMHTKRRLIDSATLSQISAANAALTDTSPFHIEEKTDHVIDAKNSKPVKLTSSGNIKKKRDVTVRAGATPDFRKVGGYAYDMSGHVHSSVERYLELSKQHVSCLKPVATSCLDDHMLDPKDDEIKGVLSGDCSKIVLKALYAARFNRVDC